MDASLPDEEEDRDLEPDADEEPVYEDEPVETEGDAALGSPVEFTISPRLTPTSLPFLFSTCKPPNPNVHDNRAQP